MRLRDLRIALKARNEIDYHKALFAVDPKQAQLLYDQAQQLAHQYNTLHKGAEGETYLSAAVLHAGGVLHLLYQNVVTAYLTQSDPEFFTRLIPPLVKGTLPQESLSWYQKEYPSLLLLDQESPTPFLLEETARGFFVHQVLLANQALEKGLKPIINPKGTLFPSSTPSLISHIYSYAKAAKSVGDIEDDLFSFLTRPAKVHPDSLTDQIQFILQHWDAYLDENLRSIIKRALDYVEEETRTRFAPGPGAIEVPSYRLIDLEGEAYSPDQNWMPNVVMMAKNTLVWLDQLSKNYGYPIERLDQIPDRELDLLAQRGFTALWLIGIWQRSAASKRIKHLAGNPEAEASAYSLSSYNISQSIGGWEALNELKKRCKERGIRLASDMVPNHTGIDSDWVIHHPQMFISTPTPPFPSYTYTGENLSGDAAVDIRIEDHYYDRSDAAVTFRRVDKSTGETAYIFHGNDGTSMPWNDTAQLDFLNEYTREAVIQQILHVARNFQIIRFDAAMTLAKRHIQRLWYPQPGHGGDIPGRSHAGMSDEEFSRLLPTEFWREVVDRIALEVPDTLLLAEAFWMMEGYFVRTLGMHRVYNSAFMNMLKDQENKKYRDTIKNTISFDSEILKRFVNFMNNPDEESAITQFGNGDKYFGIATLLCTMPGLPMFGHGQIEGFHEKYGMEYRRAYWNEYPDQKLIEEHQRRIFPLLSLRWAFSGVDYFELFDLVDDGFIRESVYAYVNGNEHQRFLILYNNQYEMAQGRLFHSAPKSIKTEEGNRINRSKTLGESLNLSVGPKRFMLYESFPENLTFLLPSITIFDEGLWVSLNGYETKMLFHIREEEDTDGAYEILYQNLGGKGTANFTQELAAIRMQPLHRCAENFASTSMMETVCAIVESRRVAPKELRKFVLLAGEAYARIEALYESLPEASLAHLPPLVHEVQPRELLQQVQTLIDCFDDEAGQTLFSFGARIMDELPMQILATLLATIFVKPNSDSALVMQTLQQLMLQLLFKDHESALNADEQTRASSLLKATFLMAVPEEVEQQLSSKHPQANQALAQLLKRKEFLAAIGANVHQGVQWYRKEELQETLYLIALGACLASQENKKKAIRMLSEWLQADLAAEYRVDRLIRHEN